jgi:Protein of unknown function (DUF2946)
LRVSSFCINFAGEKNAIVGQPELQARKLRGTTWAARLGLLALALNSLVPIHIAFDLAEALGPARHRTAHAHTHAEVGSVERHVLALLTGHGEADHEPGEHGEHGKHHGNDCPVCSALGALAGFTPPVPAAVVAAPVLARLPTTLPAIEGEPLGVFAAAYRSRAPPAA